MRGILVNKTVDPVTEQIYAEEGSHDCKFLNWNVKDTFYIRGSKNLLLQDGSIGGTVDQNCKIGAAYQSKVNCSNITIKGITFHDINVSSSTVHNEAIAATGVDNLIIENCRFERIYANTANVFFAFEQNPTLCTFVTVRNCYFGPPTNPSLKDAMQWKDNNGATGVGFHDFLIEGNLFDNCSMRFGTLSRQVGNFVVGINYGLLPQAQYDYAVGKGVKFLEYPFRPAADWPGAGTAPPIVIPPDPVVPPTDPCADVKAQLADTQAQLTKAKNDLATATDNLAAANLKITNAQKALA